MLSPSSDSSSSPNNNQMVPNMNTPYMYPTYPNMSAPEMQYQQMQPQQYYQQQTPEVMNNSVCSSDSQTLSPPMHPSSANMVNPAHFNYNLNGYPQNGYCYPNVMYP